MLNRPIIYSLFVQVGFWRLRPQTPTWATSYDPAGGLSSQTPNLPTPRKKSCGLPCVTNELWQMIWSLRSHLFYIYDAHKLSHLSNIVSAALHMTWFSLHNTTNVYQNLIYKNKIQPDENALTHNAEYTINT